MNQEIIEKARKTLAKIDLTDLPYKFAINIKLTGRISGIFYVEVLEGRLSVEPYEYIDNDASITLEKEIFDQILDGNLGIDDAIRQKKIIIDGDGEALLQLKKLF